MDKIESWKKKFPVSKEEFEKERAEDRNIQENYLEKLGELSKKTDRAISEVQQIENHIKQIEDCQKQIDKDTVNCGDKISGLKNEMQAILDAEHTMAQMLSDQFEDLKRLPAIEKHCIDVIHNRADRLEEAICRLTPNSLLSFEISLAEHCNLNCKGCDHFSPIAEKEFPDTDQLCHDFERMNELFGARIYQIHLVGGEPLLNPDIQRILIMTRSAFPKAVIDITTNGTLLLKQPQEFWDICRDYHIVIRPTKYPIAFDYDAAQKLAEINSVTYHYFGNTGTVTKKFAKFPLDKSGEQDPKRSFISCYRANKCIQLINGRLYTCTVAPNIRHFNKAFQATLEESEYDYIDIYKAKSAQEIFDFLARPIPFCRYCMPRRTIWDQPWKVSDRTEEEWV